MSYYSQVGLALDKEGEEWLQQALEKCDDKSIVDFVRSHNDFKIADENMNGTLRVWHSVEWSKNEAGVRFIERQLSYLLESNFLFIRIGEGIGDIEEYGDYYANPFDFGWETRLLYNCM